MHIKKITFTFCLIRNTLYPWSELYSFTVYFQSSWTMFYANIFKQKTILWIFFFSVVHKPAAPPGYDLVIWKIVQSMDISWTKYYPEALVCTQEQHIPHGSCAWLICTISLIYMTLTFPKGHSTQQVLRLGIIN